MIDIDNKLISEELFGAYFVCDLSQCKGGCCEEGDAGAPLEEEEKHEIERAFAAIAPLLSKEAMEVIKQEGTYINDPQAGLVTPTIGEEIGEGICVYGIRKKDGSISCAFQEAYRDGKTQWEKPISCHLFPIKIRKTSINELVNFEPRPTLCRGGCHLGEKEKVKVYTFLQTPLTRKYGASFYQSLKAVDRAYFSEPSS